MEKYIPIEKRSKKEKQALAKARRGTWGALNPVTRKPANPKAYKRKKSRHEEDSSMTGFVFLLPTHYMRKRQSRKPLTKIYHYKREAAQAGGEEVAY